jgi:hypothetical protein
MNNCTTVILFSEQANLLLNEFSATMGKILAASISTMFLLPMYNYYKVKTKSD